MDLFIVIFRVASVHIDLCVSLFILNQTDPAPRRINGYLDFLRFLIRTILALSSTSPHGA